MEIWYLEYTETAVTINKLLILTRKAGRGTCSPEQDVCLQQEANDTGNSVCQWSYFGGVLASLRAAFHTVLNMSHLHFTHLSFVTELCHDDKVNTSFSWLTSFWYFLISRITSRYTGTAHLRIGTDWVFFYIFDYYMIHNNLTI